MYATVRLREEHVHHDQRRQGGQAGLLLVVAEVSCASITIIPIIDYNTIIMRAICCLCGYIHMYIYVYIYIYIYMYMCYTILRIIL